MTSRAPEPMEAELIERLTDLTPGPPLPIQRLALEGEGDMPSAFEVSTMAAASVAATALTAGITTVDRARIAATFSGYVTRDGRAMPKWSDLSGYYRTADGGRIQFHCNFPHHADGVVELLGCEPTRDAVQEAVLDADPIELESTLIDRGMVAAYLRTLGEWDAHPHARATAHLPPITVERLGDAAPRPADRRARVLDCSRVLAGPVAGQTLGALGADVLRVGATHLPSVEGAVIATGAGKRNANTDLDTVEGRDDFARLLTGADVWLDAFRPGALAERGFTIDSCRPGVVVVQLCAFDWIGPWGGRRGFDSIVQSTTGIVEAGREAAGRADPTPLPVQALDYTTGYLAAFAARRLLDHQARDGGTWLARVSLLRTRNWLLSLGGPRRFTPARVEPSPAALRTCDGPFGRVTVPAAAIGDWIDGPQLLGSSPPVWVDSTGR